MILGVKIWKTYDYVLRKVLPNWRPVHCIFIIKFEVICFGFSLHSWAVHVSLLILQRHLLSSLFQSMYRWGHLSDIVITSIVHVVCFLFMASSTSCIGACLIWDLPWRRVCALRSFTTASFNYLIRNSVIHNLGQYQFVVDTIPISYGENTMGNSNKKEANMRSLSLGKADGTKKPQRATVPNHPLEGMTGVDSGLFELRARPQLTLLPFFDNRIWD